MSELLNRMMALQVALESRCGPLYFLALAKRVDLPEKWDILISAEQLMDTRDGYFRAFDVFNETLGSSAAYIASINISNPGDPQLSAMFRTIRVDRVSRASEFINTSFNGVTFAHIYIFKSLV